MAENKIVHDRFHIMQLATKAMDQVRRAEHKQLSAGGEKLLANSRYLWLRNPENHNHEQDNRIMEIYDQTLQTSKAWAVKETLRELWDATDRIQATRFLSKQYRWAIRSKLVPNLQFARSLKSRLPYIASYHTHRITNAVAGGISSKIMSIKRRVDGYGKLKNLKL